MRSIASRSRRCTLMRARSAALPARRARPPSPSALESSARSASSSSRARDARASSFHASASASSSSSACARAVRGLRAGVDQLAGVAAVDRARGDSLRRELEHVERPPRLLHETCEPAQALGVLQAHHAARVLHDPHLALEPHRDRRARRARRGRRRRDDAHLRAGRGAQPRELPLDALRVRHGARRARAIERLPQQYPRLVSAALQLCEPREHLRDRALARHPEEAPAPEPALDAPQASLDALGERAVALPHRDLRDRREQRAVSQRDQEIHLVRTEPRRCAGASAQDRAEHCGHHTPEAHPGARGRHGGHQLRRLVVSPLGAQQHDACDEQRALGVGIARALTPRPRLVEPARRVLPAPREARIHRAHRRDGPGVVRLTEPRREPLAALDRRASRDRIAALEAVEHEAHRASHRVDGIAERLRERDVLRVQRRALGGVGEVHHGGAGGAERVEEHAAVAGRASERDRLARERDRLVGVGRGLARGGEARHHARTERTLIGRQPRERVLEQPHELGVDAGVDERRAVAQRRPREQLGPLGSRELRGRATGLLTAQHVARADARASEPEQQLDPCAARARVTRCLEPALVPRDRLLEREPRERLLGRARRARGRAISLAGAGEPVVVRDLARRDRPAGRAAALEHLGRARVQVGAQLGGEIVVQHLAQQHVREAQTVGPGLDQHPRLDAGAQPRGDGGRLAPRELGDLRDAHLAAEHRRELEQLERRGRQRVDPLAQHRADAVRHRARRRAHERGHARLRVPVARQLDDEERVPLGRRVDRAHELVAGATCLALGEQHRDVGLLESPQLDLPCVAREPREGARVQRALGLERAVGREEHQRRTAEVARDVLRDEQRRGVGGVQIFEEQQGGRARRGAEHERADGVDLLEARSLGIERLRLRRRVPCAELGQPASQQPRTRPERLLRRPAGLGLAQRAQHLDPRPERGCPAHLPRSAPHHGVPASRRLIRDLLDETALAHPGLAAEEPRAPSAARRGFDRTAEPLELLRAADDRSLGPHRARA